MQGTCCHDRLEEILLHCEDLGWTPTDTSRRRVMSQVRPTRCTLGEQQSLWSAGVCKQGGEMLQEAVVLAPSSRSDARNP